MFLIEIAGLYQGYNHLYHRSETIIHLSTIGKVKKLCLHTVSLVEILPYCIWEQ